MKKERITLFLGGTSSERDVSLASGVRIAADGERVVVRDGTAVWNPE